MTLNEKIRQKFLEIQNQEELAEFLQKYPIKIRDYDKEMSDKLSWIIRASEENEDKPEDYHEVKYKDMEEYRRELRGEGDNEI